MGPALAPTPLLTLSLGQPGSMEASARCLSVGPGYRKERVQDSVCHPSSSVSRSAAYYHRDSGFYSRHFIVSKKDGGLSPVLDLQVLNSALRKFRFKMLMMKLIASQIRSKDWFVTMDLKYAYFHIGVRKFLRFAFGGEVYQFRVLPFGLALSLRTFTKCIDAALAPLHLQSIHVLNYLDDWLILAHSKAMAASHQEVVLAHMRSLGLKINPEKCVLSPSQRTTFLGVIPP
ncbi:hypothetical protein QTP70_005368 [Hemibagrus guttatus]|uniref:ribonuclease H n=1 Tax=Hemibagrus guttatus TaxID=175788 RepID=A0AAE0QAE7_9TELE|nr:hypothetical protein QTP70_005368 [Hemibagrus guttatus]